MQGGPMKTRRNFGTNPYNDGKDLGDYHHDENILVWFYGCEIRNMRG